MIAEVLVKQQQLPLNHARAQLRMTQEQLSTESGIPISVIRNCEQGRGRISLLSAYAILDALNRIRAERNLPALKLKDLSWKIRE